MNDKSYFEIFSSLSLDSYPEKSAVSVGFLGMCENS